jgi:hypothetical protein
MPAHAAGAHAELNRFPIAPLIKKMVGDHAMALPETSVGLLQGYNVGVDLRQHVQDPFGISPSIGAYTLANIVARDFYHSASATPRARRGCSRRIGSVANGAERKARENDTRAGEA